MHKTWLDEGGTDEDCIKRFQECPLDPCIEKCKYAVRLKFISRITKKSTIEYETHECVKQDTCFFASTHFNTIMRIKEVIAEIKNRRR